MRVVKQFRSNVALDLWNCRKEFKLLPMDIKKDVIEFWNKSYVPKEPFRFLSLIHRWKVDPLYFEREKGNASRYIKSIIGADGTLKVIEVSQDEYYAHMGYIDKNKK